MEINCPSMRVVVTHFGTVTSVGVASRSGLEGKNGVKHTVLNKKSTVSLPQNDNSAT